MALQKWSESIWVATPGTDPAFSDEVEGLSTTLAHHEPPPHLVVDLEDCHHLNSSNLSQLLRLRKACADRGVQLRLAAPNNAAWSIFMTTGLDKVFSFSRDRLTALAELQMTVPADGEPGEDAEA
ncbi:MAG: STAS domain-containing protein [Planctomycetota bacterium]